jgi:hypothetical protein
MILIDPQMKFPRSEKEHRSELLNAREQSMNHEILTFTHCQRALQCQIT